MPKRTKLQGGGTPGGLIRYLANRKRNRVAGVGPIPPPSSGSPAAPYSSGAPMGFKKGGVVTKSKYPKGEDAASKRRQGVRGTPKNPTYPKGVDAGLKRRQFKSGGVVGFDHFKASGCGR